MWVFHAEPSPEVYLGPRLLGGPGFLCSSGCLHLRGHLDLRTFDRCSLEADGGEGKGERDGSGSCLNTLNSCTKSLIGYFKGKPSSSSETAGGLSRCHRTGPVPPPVSTGAAFGWHRSIGRRTRSVSRTRFHARFTRHAWGLVLDPLWEQKRRAKLRDVTKKNQTSRSGLGALSL